MMTRDLWRLLSVIGFLFILVVTLWVGMFLGVWMVFHA